MHIFLSFFQTEKQEVSFLLQKNEEKGLVV